MNKENLDRIRIFEKEIEQKKMELEALRFKVTDVDGIRTDMDRVQNSPDDYMTLAIADIIEYEKQIKEDETEIEGIKGQAYLIVKKMENPEHRTFIEWYYLNGLSMLETAARMNISERTAYYLRDTATEVFENFADHFS